MPSGNGNSTKWITVNGAHIPIEGGETKRQAVKKLRQKQNTLEIYADPKGNSKVQRLLERFDREFSNEPFMVTKRGYSGITPQNPEKRRLYTRLLKRLDDEIEKDPKVKTKTKLVEDKSIYAMDAYKDVIAGIRSQIGKKNPVYNFTVPKNFPKEDIPALKAAIAVLIDHEERAYMQKKRKKLSMDAFYAGVRRAFDDFRYDNLDKKGRLPWLSNIKTIANYGDGYPNKKAYKIAREFQNKFGKEKLYPMEVYGRKAMLPKDDEKAYEYDRLHRKFVEAWAKPNKA